MIDVDEATSTAHWLCPLNGCMLRQAAMDGYSIRTPYCSWPGHAAIRALRSAAYRSGLEAAARIVDESGVDCGHEPSAEHAERCNWRSPADTIRSLAAKEASDG